MHCQVETLRRCFPPGIRRILGELPKTLDETYERILMEIDEEKQAYANRLFQCLAISIRSLRVEELAEIFAVLPDAESTQGFDMGWRPEDPEAFILSACSTLVSIVDVWGKKVVQFSHFSVREYLTSDRIANSSLVSPFHILPQLAHTLLARACLTVLLQLDNSIDGTGMKSFPLARYAAKYWVDHVQFAEISSNIQDGMDFLFDRNKPHFAAWIRVFDLDNPAKRRWSDDLDDDSDDSDDPDGYPDHPGQPVAVPLYYAALCGFRDLAERLLDAYPYDVNARGGYYETPLLAALNKEHPKIALLLLERGADGESRGRQRQTALYEASSRGYAEVVRSLVDRGEDLNVECDDWDDGWLKVKWTPLLVALKNGRPEVATVLLKHGADANYQDKRGKSPLHIASRHPSGDLARLLLDHGANLNASDTRGKSALHETSSNGQITLVKLLLEYGADADTRNNSGWTPLHYAARDGHPEVVLLLLDHGADANAQKKDRLTALHLAAANGHLQVVEVLLKRDADPHARDRGGKTPFQLASVRNRTQIMRLLSEHTGEKM